MRILQVINDGVCVFICRVFSDVFKIYTSHVFVYESYFAQLENSEYCGSIVDNRSYAHICVLKQKYRTRKTTPNHVLMNFFEGSCIVDYSFKVPANDIS